MAIQTQTSDTLATGGVDSREKMNIVIAGHVDHGKSTIIGRLLADTNSLPQGKLEFVRQQCLRNSKPFEYAFLLDALKDEQSQGITIDAARVFFKTEQRHYIIIDAPGHIEFLKNMVTGASRAEAALLVIDAKEGIRENSRRHGYMLSMLGIRQIVVLVNKMDLVSYEQQVFDDIVKEYAAFLKEIAVEARAFIPVSGFHGDNVASRGKNMPWHEGGTALEALDQFEKEQPPLDKPFRMFVQDIYKFTRASDDRRIVAGTIDAGVLRAGDELIFYPSGKKCRVAGIEGFNRAQKPERAAAGAAVGFTLEEQIYISRGQLAARADQPAPRVGKRLRVNIFWMGREPMTLNKTYQLKVGASKVECELEELTRVIDASDLQSDPDRTRIDRHEVAECVLKLRRDIAFDRLEDGAATSRFVIVDDYEIRGGGILREDLPDEETWVREHVMMRNQKWVASQIALEQRAEKYNQKAALLLITGAKSADKKSLARELEAQLFADGRIVNYIGIANILYGVDADIKIGGEDHEHHQEHLRRMAEVAHLMLQAGLIIIITLSELATDDLAIIRTTIDAEMIEVIWLGDAVTTGAECGLRLNDANSVKSNVARIKSRLQEKGIIFNPYR